MAASTGADRHILSSGARLAEGLGERVTIAPTPERGID
jgi:hypothetical protein